VITGDDDDFVDGACRERIDQCRGGRLVEVARAQMWNPMRDPTANVIDRVDAAQFAAGTVGDVDGIDPRITRCDQRDGGIQLGGTAWDDLEGRAHRLLASDT
jgi:hypothetical protein